MSYAIAYGPGLSAFAEYRLLGIAGSCKVKFGYGPAKLPASVKLLAEYDNEVGVGLRPALHIRLAGPHGAGTRTRPGFGAGAGAGENLPRLFRLG